MFRKLLTLILLAHASQAGASALFEDDGILEVNLAGPLGSLFADKYDNQELPFVLEADDIEHQIKVRVRGNSRRRVCSFPPLRFNFSTDENATQSVFHDQEKLKLVTHCRDNRSANRSVLTEYAAYRIFSLLSDVSYRVRLLRVNYSDTDGSLKEEGLSRYAFLIESTEALAARIDGQAEQVPAVTRSSLESRQAATVYIFQYLIGNTDWSLVAADGDDACCHNGDLFDIDATRYYVPYDFDLAGLVNASYARPAPSLGISRVTDRRYRGYCISTDALQEALTDIKARRTDILGVIEKLPGLSQKEVKVSVDYLGKFFDRVNDNEKIVRMFDRACL